MTKALMPPPVATDGDPRLGPAPWDGRERPGTRGRLLALLALNVLLAAFYFSWLLRPERVGVAVLFGLLIAAELYNLVQAAGFWWTLSRGKGRARRRWAGPEPGVDVFIPVFGEPVEIVEPTVERALLLRGADLRVVLLDDGDDPAMRAMAQRRGAHYFTREHHTGAKAGNINHALGHTDGEFVLILDCDHVPRPDFLEATLGWLEDGETAFVQTPQCYANAPQGGVAGAAWAQQALFFGAIARGKDAHGAMFCAGTNVVFSRTALEGAGGFPEDSLTEDFALSVRLHEQGWRSAYVPEVLALGLGPEDTASYVSQQQRWARGCLGAIGPVLRARLPFRLKVQYLLSTMYFLSGWTVLVYMTFPVVRILLGDQPLASASADQFLVHFVPYFTASLLTVAVAGGGAYTFNAFALAAANFWIHLQATATTLLRRRGRFVVTPKQGAVGAQPRAVWPALVVLGLLTAVALHGLLRDRSPATLNNVTFAALHITVLVCGVAAALRPAPAPRRRRILRSGLAVVGAVASVSVATVALAATFPGAEPRGAPGLSSDRAAVVAADRFLDRYMQPDGRVVRRDQGGDTVAEGQAYAMLAAVAINDQERFDAAWGWARDELQRSDGLLANRWADGRVEDPNPATDADLDAARALLLAERRFGDRRYAAQGEAIGDAVLAGETIVDSRTGARALAAGTWARDRRVVNPSYASPASFRALDQRAEGRAWRGVASTERRTLGALTRGGRLPPDWGTRSLDGRVRATPPPGRSERPVEYAFDAVRVPIRLAESCAPADRRIAARLWPTLRRTGNAGVLPRRLDGTPSGAIQHASALAGAAGAARAAGDRRAAADLLDRAVRADRADPTYYGAAWAALGKLMLQTDRLEPCGER